MRVAPTFTDRAASEQSLLATRPLIRAVNFHNTARVNAAKYDRQLAQYKKSFSAVSQRDLDQYLLTGNWHKPKPGLIVSVFEGYRNNYDVFAPLLDKYEFIGWFFIITSFLNSSIKDQRAFAEAHSIDMETHEYPDGRYALHWDEVRQLDKKHVVASHARTHSQLSRMSPDAVEREVVGSQRDFEKELGHKVRAFVSLTGPPYGQDATSDRLIQAAGYSMVFSNFGIQRLPSAS